MNTTASLRRGIVVTIIAGLIPIAALAAHPGEASASTKGLKAAGGCWNKPVLPDWCQPPGIDSA